jgi:hypothetical protein
MRVDAWSPVFYRSHFACLRGDLIRLKARDERQFPPDFNRLSIDVLARSANRLFVVVALNAMRWRANVPVGTQNVDLVL